jgi:hypothetical protein
MGGAGCWVIMDSAARARLDGTARMRAVVMSSALTADVE